MIMLLLASQLKSKTSSKTCSKKYNINLSTIYTHHLYKILKSKSYKSYNRLTWESSQKQLLMPCLIESYLRCSNKVFKLINYRECSLNCQG